MRRHLGPATLAVLMLLMAAPTQASPIEFSFTGTLTRFSTITKANGDVIDMSFAPFTVTGFTTGIDPGWVGANRAWTDFNAHPFSAVATWDFGINGKAIADMDYVEYSVAGSNLLGSVALDYGWNPNRVMSFDALRGLQVRFDPVAIDWSLTDPTPLGQLHQFTAQQFFSTFSLTMTDGGTFTSRFSGLEGTQMSITSVEVKEVPEPATLLLVSLGMGLLFRRRR